MTLRTRLGFCLGRTGEGKDGVFWSVERHRPIRGIGVA